MTPLWFPVEDHQCFGWWHLPASGRAHSAAILCPPLGMEHLVVDRTMRTLAESLSSHGVACLRFDYPGTGDPTGDLTYNPALLLTRPDKAVGGKVRLLAEDPRTDVVETVDKICSSTFPTSTLAFLRTPSSRLV